jgi:hypothetical protein
MEETLREIQAHSFIYKFEICALLRNYAGHKGNYLPTFRDNIWDPTGCPETSAITTTRCLSSQKSAYLISFAAEA